MLQDSFQDHNVDYKVLIDALLILTSYQSGIDINQIQLLASTQKILEDIDSVIADDYSR